MIALFNDSLRLSRSRNILGTAEHLRTFYFGEAHPIGVPLNLDRLIEALGIQQCNAGLRSSAAILIEDVRGSFSVRFIINRKKRSEIELRFLKAKLIADYFFDCQEKIANSSYKTGGGLKLDEEPFLVYLREPGPELLMRRSVVEGNEALSLALAAELILPEAFATDLSFTDLEIARRFVLPTEFVGIRRRRLNGSPNSQTVRTDLSESLLGPKEPVADNDDHRLDVLKSENPASPLIPRAYAALTYRTTQVATGNVAMKQQVQSSSSPTVEKSLSRIRELARKIDKSV